ncbi:MAG: FapA family protein [Pseudomonadota bacterium]
MEQEQRILSLPELALEYGTITAEQFKQISQLHAQKQQQDDSVDWSELLLNQRMATHYQVGLLKLIQDYMILKKKGEAFGKIAIEKGFASQEDINKALELQKKEFKRAKTKKLIGDILVESRVITVKQKNMILKEQTFLDNQTKKILNTDTIEDNSQAADHKQEEQSQVILSKYDQQFLQIKVLDQEFAASVIEKGLASKHDVTIAEHIQQEAYEKESRIQLLGDIMVQLKLITDEQKNLILMEQERLDDNQTLELNSGIHVSISPDQMEAVIQIKNYTQTIGLNQIKTALKTKGVCNGIYPDALLQCNLDVKNTTFIAARQDYAIDLIKERKAAYHFNTNAIDTEQKNMGALLAEQEIMPEIHLKKSVFGKNIEQPSGHENTFRCGAGTRLSKDKTKVFAGKTGFPSFSIERKLFIHPAITVLEDADLKYGALEKYASLNISGTLTGAYPVTAGNVLAREIRGATIHAIGNVTAQIGINESVINAQGDIHARYLHSSTVYAFGNIYVENEIIDSKIFCSGKIESPKCRIISSDLYGKKGVTLSGAGNNRTRPCVICSGTEHHILEIIQTLNQQTQTIRQQLDDLIEQKNAQKHFANKTFQKMIELKLFHDRAKKKKELLSEEFKTKRDSYKKEKLKNIATLVNNFQNRMTTSVSLLKELNKNKKDHEIKKENIEKKIVELEPQIHQELCELKIDLLAFLEWARKKENVVQIKINNTAHSGTIFKGIFSSMEIKKDLNCFSIFEKQLSDNGFELFIQNH